MRYIALTTGLTESRQSNCVSTLTEALGSEREEEECFSAQLTLFPNSSQQQVVVRPTICRCIRFGGMCVAAIDKMQNNEGPVPMSQALNWHTALPAYQQIVNIHLLCQQLVRMHKYVSGCNI